MVSAGSHREDAETARACRVGRQWGQRAAWWPPGRCGERPGAWLPDHSPSANKKQSLSQGASSLTAKTVPRPEAAPG
uniref:Uncharacterized protein n=1 Tax=Rangifer tarandus platyrhynchus TaxID=3082113 RepID=A0ACB0ELE4_RANTA|nr:unnamed protein product [Rangifer tarandus platyrhynchus]